eukprot:515361-Lingulodinium_polyedra.AAC.1
MCLVGLARDVRDGDRDPVPGGAHAQCPGPALRCGVRRFAGATGPRGPLAGAVDIYLAASAAFH